jgi:hypothetical protein
MVTNEMLRRPLTQALYHAPQQAAYFTPVKKGGLSRSENNYETVNKSGAFFIHCNAVIKAGFELY